MNHCDDLPRNPVKVTGRKRQAHRTAGFDHPPLDTVVLAMPISWKGTLQQYAGRLHREHANKTSVRIIDFVDTGHPALLRMWERRRRGYQAMGYRIPVAPVGDKLNFGEAVDGRARSGLDVLTAPVATAGRGR